MARMKSFSSARQFVALPTSVVQGNYLSAQAGWLLLLCMSYPDEWTYVPRNLWKALPYGRDIVYRSLNELVEHGHLIKIYHLQGNLRRGCDYIFFDSIESCKSFVENDLNQQSDIPIETEHKWSCKSDSKMSSGRDSRNWKVGYNEREGIDASTIGFSRITGSHDSGVQDSYQEEDYKKRTPIMNQEEDHDSEFPIDEDFSEVEAEKTTKRKRRS